MAPRTLALFGGMLLGAVLSGCAGYVADERYVPPPPPPPPPSEPANLEQPLTSVVPKANPHRPHEIATKETAKKSGSEPERTASKEAKGPLTPAEIRAAVPVQKVNNPKQTLSDAEIKSLWGENIGQVQSVDVSGGTVKAVDANVSGSKGKVVRIDPARLKYVKSRNLLITTMSKPDVEKLPKANNS
jgi:hypothetical protein